MTEELKALEVIGNMETPFVDLVTKEVFISDIKVKDANDEEYNIVKSALKRKEKLEEAIRDLFANHIEFVAEEDKCYFKIKNSKGKEISFTSKAFEDFWKEVQGDKK